MILVDMEWSFSFAHVIVHHRDRGILWYKPTQRLPVDLQLEVFDMVVCVGTDKQDPQIFRGHPREPALVRFSRRNRKCFLAWLRFRATAEPRHMGVTIDGGIIKELDESDINPFMRVQ